jgi:DNA polymerase III sliding clamp (beta) subunit (PCNA family)
MKFPGDANHLFFEFGPRLLIRRELTGNFPDYGRMLPHDTGISRGWRRASPHCHTLSVAARDKGASTSLRSLTVLNGLFKYASAR